MREALKHLRKNDPVLAKVIRKIGPFAIQYREPCFETLVRSIVSQQVSGKAAATVYARFSAIVTEENRPFCAESVLLLSPEQMRLAGLSGQKASYLRNLAEHTVSGELDFTCLDCLTDEEVIAKLTQVKGIGVWTAHMFLMFGLRRPNVLPVGDLGVRAGIKLAYGLEEMPTPAEMREIAANWDPYCSVASWYMWRCLDGTATL